MTALDIANKNYKTLLFTLTYFFCVILLGYSVVPLNTLAVIAFCANTMSAGLGPLSTLCRLYKTGDNRYLNFPMFLTGGFKYLIWFTYGLVEYAFPILFS